MYDNATPLPVTLKTHSIEGSKKNNFIKNIFHRMGRKIFPQNVIPFGDKSLKGNGFYYRGKKYIPYSDLPVEESAIYTLSKYQIINGYLLLVLFLLGLVLDWKMTAIFTVAIVTVMYFSDLLFNLYLVLRSFSKRQDIVISDDEIVTVLDHEWPTYTVFCPLYKEYQVVPQFVTAISRLDYPKDKLQIMLLLEENDTETVHYVQNYNLPHYFETVIVPHSMPKTKPKALNYGLLFAKGEYTVIYDAEDIPDPDQLKKVILAFKKADKKLACIQAKLNFYNPHQNFLTKLFAAEYSLWFELVLTGLQSIDAPIPLGGTSNHFRTKDLLSLKGWDSFNVTEDCDLGMRLVKKGYRTAIIDSVTLEEANSDIMNWFRQRSRWIKGYIQTYLQHMRTPEQFISTWKKPHILTFQLVVGGKVLSMIINPLMWVITISYFTLHAHVGVFIEQFFPTPVLYMSIISLVIGNFLYMYYYMIGCYRHGHHSLVKYMYLVPLYWLAMSIAAWVAVYTFITDPHYWAKTTHGLHLNNEKAFGQVLVNANFSK